MEVAMKSLSSSFEFRIRWEPYLLKPDTPVEGLPIPEVYTDPNNPRVQSMMEIAASLGIEYTTSRKKFANTLLGHALLEYAKKVDDGAKQNEVAEKLFQRCFTNGDMLQEDTILGVAQECDFDLQNVKEFINSNDNMQSVLEKAMKWTNDENIEMVPTYFLNGHQMITGAEEPELFEQMFKEAAEKYSYQLINEFNDLNYVCN